MIVNRELENFKDLYFPNFKLTRHKDFDEEYETLVEYLSVIKQDLKGLINYIEETKKGIYKERLIEKLCIIRNSLLVDIEDIFDKNTFIPRELYELLEISVTDNYIMFSIYPKDNDYEYKIFYPLVVIMSRKLKNMEFYFLEKVEQEEPYIDSYFLTYFELEKNNVHMEGSYIKDYSFIKSDTESCVLNLKKYKR